MKDTLQLLEAYLKRGFCLHGSKFRIETLVEPRQARCNTGREDGCQKAVYASKNCVRVPCLMAMFASASKSESYKASYTAKGSGLMVVSGENVTFRPGYVHVLPSATFRDVGDEFISYEPVAPHEIVLVTPAILRLLPHMDLRVPIPAKW